MRAANGRPYTFKMKLSLTNTVPVRWTVAGLRSRRRPHLYFLPQMWEKMQIKSNRGSQRTGWSFSLALSAAFGSMRGKVHKIGEGECPPSFAHKRQSKAYHSGGVTENRLSCHAKRLCFVLFWGKPFRQLKERSYRWGQRLWQGRGYRGARRAFRRRQPLHTKCRAHASLQ